MSDFITAEFTLLLLILVIVKISNCNDVKWLWFVSVLYMPWWFASHVCEYFNIETQKPRPFFDSRDKGLHITYWDVEAGEKVPPVPLSYSFEVNNLQY
jgi:hypothetical protein